MAVEKFYDPSVVEGEAEEGRTLTIRWGVTQPVDAPVEVGNVRMDRSAINRMIRVLRRARNAMFEADE